MTQPTEVQSHLEISHADVIRALQMLMGNGGKRQVPDSLPLHSKLALKLVQWIGSDYTMYLLYRTSM